MLGAGASAQSFRSGYFLDNYVYGYHINPAQVNEESFVGFVLTDIDLQHNANFGMGTLLFPRNGKVVTGFNKAVTADEFLGGLSTPMTLSLDENINLLSFGIVKNKKTMHTFEVNLRTLGSVALPYDLFAFLKKGGNETYDLSGLDINVGVVGDIAYGYSRRINSQLSVGGRIHALIGVVNVNAYTDNSSIALSPNETDLQSEINLQTCGILSLATDEDNKLDFGNTAMDGSPIGGYGAGLDLGVEYKPIEDLSITASVTDLGFISWKSTTSLKANANIRYTGGNIVYDDGDFETDFEDLLDDLTEAIEFKEAEAVSRMSLMPLNAALGVRYKMPFYKPLSVGVLGTYHVDSIAPWFDVRGGLTFTPSYLLSISGNVGYGTYGPTFGAALNAHLGPINLVLGADSFMGDMGKLNGIPVPLDNILLNLHLGLTASF